MFLLAGLRLQYGGRDYSEQKLNVASVHYGVGLEGDVAENRRAHGHDLWSEFGAGLQD